MSERNVSGDVCERVYIASGICGVLWLQRGESCDRLTRVNHSIHFGANPVHINQGRVLGVRRLHKDHMKEYCMLHRGFCGSLSHEI